MTRSRKTINDIARATGVFPADACRFLRDGLDYAASALHGPMTPTQTVVSQYMAREAIDHAELAERYRLGRLDPVVGDAIRQAGGVDRFNRNVSGRDLCWALRDYAMKRWGMLADVVLNSWHIETTDDFGALVFALVDHGVMQKEPHDSHDDFKSVYDFDDAFRTSYRITLNRV